ncbi:MAG: hypothetical protein SFU25_03850 [Candidatus Caenarcaniphilales bacterium]|nr:hypothetical protein [Candidatus Caenarcaniphilales bacterium]
MSTQAIQATGSGSTTQGTDKVKQFVQQTMQSAEQQGIDPKQAAEQLRAQAEQGLGVGNSVNYQA